MRVTYVDYYLCHQFMREGTVNGPEYPEQRWDLVPKYFIQVHTDAGIIGAGETPRGVREDAVVAGARALVGQDPLALPLEHLPLPRNSAFMAYEIAIFDIVGKAQGKRVVDLLGGAVRDRVAVDWWSGRRTPDDLARWAKEGWERGFRGLKIKCTIQDPMVERVRRCYKTVPAMKMTIDPNCRFYRAEDTLELAHRLQPYPNVACFEDPIPKDDQRAYAALHRQMRDTGIPLGLHLGSVEQLRQALELECIDIVNCSPPSMVTFVEMARVAGEAGIPCWHGSGNDCGILDLAYVHCCAAAPNCTHPSDIMGNILHVDDFLVEPIRFEGGDALVPDRPGLGGELDMAAVERYLISRGRVES